jgi:carboxymethylenebutenolidase
VGTVSPNDPAVKGADIKFPGEGGELMGYLAQPSAAGKYPVVLVCHENRGLTDHIKDVTRRLAKAGYAALAVDLLSRQGGTATIAADQVPGTLSSISPDQYGKDFNSGRKYFQDKAFAQPDKVGMVGFCYGGGVTWLVASRMPELKAAVPYYGPLPPVSDVPSIRAAVLGIYGALDTRIVSGIPPIEEAMKANGKIFEKVIYPNADHAFNNDTGTRYNPEAAAAAWKRTLEWFAKYLV